MKCPYLQYYAFGRRYAPDQPSERENYWQRFVDRDHTVHPNAIDDGKEEEVDSVVDDHDDRDDRDSDHDS